MEALGSEIETCSVFVFYFHFQTICLESKQGRLELPSNTFKVLETVVLKHTEYNASFISAHPTVCILQYYILKLTEQINVFKKPL